MLEQLQFSVVAVFSSVNGHIILKFGIENLFHTFYVVTFFFFQPSQAQVAAGNQPGRGNAPTPAFQAPCNRCLSYTNCICQ